MVLNLWVPTQTFHRGCLRLPENPDIYVVMYNIAKLQLRSINQCSYIVGVPTILRVSAIRRVETHSLLYKLSYWLATVIDPTAIENRLFLIIASLLLLCWVE